LFRHPLIIAPIGAQRQALLTERLPESGEMLAFAHIPTGITASKRFDIDEVKIRSIATRRRANRAIGADIEIGRATP
jgi:hypothetical protein